MVEKRGGKEEGTRSYKESLEGRLSPLRYKSGREKKGIRQRAPRWKDETAQRA